MSTWADTESSTQEHISDLTGMDYAPDTCEDLSFAGVAVGCAERCRVHNLPPTKCVAFEGTNTGRRFYVCSVPNPAMNCGFVSWADVEKLLEDTQSKAMAETMRKIKEDNEAIFDLTRKQLEGEVIKYQEKIAEMKEEKSRWWEIEKMRKTKWEKEMEVLKEQKKKAEYACYDLLKMSNVNKEKLQKIKELCADL